ncbi:signal recognition particle receptor subunit beta [[Candida] railenensis]|uniref:Signal recognition particle receptor subunit beta n=1 Tax=[Candida] railenensis TaxID=45579 RepID=A0A9P0QRJ5_9ASCO|nr:signal recognition particle receptor subunit beta [[Candida] railenensis]
MDGVQITLLTLLLGLLITLGVSYFQSTTFGKIGVKSKHNRPTFMILGPNNAGKTALYFRLVNKLDDEDSGSGSSKISPTVSSIEPNFGEVNLPFSSPSIGKPFQLIDFPGHLKYSQLLSKLMLEEVTLRKIKGVVYVIDSSSELVEIAKNLFKLFPLTERLTNGIDFLFAVNKNDLFNSRPVFKIQEILESEISKLIKQELSEKSRVGGSGIDQGDDDDDVEEGVASFGDTRDFWSSVVSSKQEFKFEMLEGNMDFYSGSVLKNKISPWENWFDEKVVNTT